MNPTSEDFDVTSLSSRLLHVYCEGTIHFTIYVTNADKTSRLYAVETHLRKPHLKFHSLLSNSAIGTADYHTFKTRIDTTIHGHSVSLNTKGSLKPGYTYMSPAFSNSQMFWEQRSKCNDLNLVLLDDKAMPVARFESVNWSVKKFGKLELLNSCLGDDKMVDEIVVTAIALVYFKWLRNRAVATTAAPVVVTS
jgi:hypothetical protein